MTPKAAKKKQQKEVSALETLGIVPKWSTFAELKSYRSDGADKKRFGFDQMCERRVQLKDEIDFRKALVDKLDEEIQIALATAGVDKVLWEDRPVQVITKHAASRIVAEKLLELGVEADTVAQATVEGSEYSYVLFGKPKA